MLVTYCDLCGQPIKDNESYRLYVAEPVYKNQQNDEEQSYYGYLDKVQKNTKEICPTCKKIIDEIFKLRLENISKIVQYITDVYNLPSKDKI